MELDLPQVECADSRKQDAEWMCACNNNLTQEESNTLLFMLVKALKLKVTRVDGTLLLEKDE